MPVSIRKTWVLWVFSDISCVASSLTPSIYLLFFHSNFPISSEYPKIQFSFNTNSGVKAQSHKAALTTKVSHNGVPRLPTLLLEDYKFRGSCDPPCRSNNSLEWITKLWEAFYLLLPAYYKGENSGTPQGKKGREKSWGKGATELLCRPRVCHFPNNPWNLEVYRFLYRFHYIGIND